MIAIFIMAAVLSAITTMGLYALDAGRNIPTNPKGRRAAR